MSEYGGVATGPLRAVQRGDLRLKVHVTQEGWNHLLCGRPYGNKYHREHGDPELLRGKGMCKLCEREYLYLKALYAWRDNGQQGPRPVRTTEVQGTT